MSAWTPRNKQGARCPHCQHMHYLRAGEVGRHRLTCENKECGALFFVEVQISWRTRADLPKGPAPIAQDPDRRKRHKLRMWGPPGFREWLLEQPCCISGGKATDMSHVKSRGAGYGAENNAVPMDRRSHMEYEAGKESFEDRYNVDLQELARRYWSRWLQHQAREERQAKRGGLMKDQRKACYSAALDLWRRAGSEPGRKPSPEAFVLTSDEAREVEVKGYDHSCLPDHLRPAASEDGDVT